MVEKVVWETAEEIGKVEYKKYRSSGGKIITKYIPWVDTLKKAKTLLF